MIYFIPTAEKNGGYISDSDWFKAEAEIDQQVITVVDGEEVVTVKRVVDLVTFTKGWLRLATPEELASIGAVPQPEITQYQRILRGVDGWVVEDWTQEEIDAHDAALAASEVRQAEQAADAEAALLPNAINRLWKQAWDVWGEAQIAAVDRTTIAGWVAAGVLSETGKQMWVDIIHWHDAIYDNEYTAARLAIEAAGDWVEPDWASWTPCPHSFNDFKTQRIA